MKNTNKNYFKKQPKKIVYALVLASILSLGTGLTLILNATAAPSNPFAKVGGVVEQGDRLPFTVVDNTVANLPPEVADAVLHNASQQSQLPLAQLRIVQAQSRQWSDGCLGLGGNGVFCTSAIVPGYLVTVEAGQQLLVYRTDTVGKNIQLDKTASQTDDASTFKPVIIPENELPPPLQRKVIFRAITSGGIAGLTTEINLFKDGQVIQVQVNSNGTTSQTQIYRISQQQLGQFRQVLKQHDAFNGLQFPPPKGAADYITVTLTSRAGTTRYTQINQDRLPSSLQTVVQAWNQLLSTIKTK